MSLIDLLNTLNSLIRPIKCENNDVCKINPENLCEKIFNVIFDDEDNFKYILPSLTIYSRENNSIILFKYDKMSQKIDELFSLSLNFEEKIRKLRPVLVLLPFCCDDHFMLIMDKLIALIDENIDGNHGNVPDFLVETSSLIKTGLISQSSLELLYDRFKNVYENKNNGANIVLGLMIKDILACVDDSDEYLLSYILNLIDGNKHQKLVAFFMLKNFDSYLSEANRIILDKVFTKMLPYFVSEDDELFYHSHKVMNHFIRLVLFNTKYNVDELLKQYPLYKPEKVNYFFKFIQKLLEDPSNVDSSIIQPIYDFMIALYENSSPLIKANFMEIFTLLAASNREAFSDVYEMLLDDSNELIKETEHRYEIYCKVGCLYLGLSKVIPETFPIILKEHIAGILTIFSDLSTDGFKLKLELAHSLASLVEDGNHQEVSSVLIDYIMNVLSNIKGSVIFYLGSIVMAFKDKFTDEQANKLMNYLIEFVKSSQIETQKNICYNMMKKLLKRYTFDVDFMENLVLNILEGGFTGGVEPHLVSDSNSMIFYFVAAYIRKYPLRCSKLVDKLLRFLKTSGISIIPAVLETFEALIMNGLLQPDDIKEVGRISLELMSIIPFSEEESFCASAEIGILLVKRHSQLININEFLKKAVVKLALSNGYDADNSEEDVESYTDTMIAPTLARLILYIYLDKSVQFDKETLKTVIEELPYNQGMDDVFIPLMKMLDEKEKFNNIYSSICQVMVSLIMSGSDNYEESGLTQETAKEAQEKLKIAFKSDKMLERIVTKDFQRSKAKMHKFNTLFK